MDAPVTSRLARLALRGPRRIVALVAVAVCVAAPVGLTAFDALDPYVFEDPGTESARAAQAIEEATGARADGGVIVLVEGGRGRVDEVARVVERDPDVRAVSGSPSWIARDGASTYLVAFVRPDAEGSDVSERLTAAFAGERDVTLGGTLVADHQIAEQSEQDLRRAELLAFPLLFVLTLLFFRSLVAAALPLLLGAIAIVGALAALRLLHEVAGLSVLSINAVTGIGLGLAIDYSLFIVSRFREELARGHPTPAALHRTLLSAGRTVLFSSLTVACAMASLLLFPQQFLYSMGIGGIAVALLSATGALLVLPAVLALLGPRVNALAPAWLQRSRRAIDLPDREGRWYRLSRWVTRRPVLVAVLASAVLIVAALPLLRMEFVPGDAGVLADDRSAGVVDRAIAAGFPPGFADSMVVQLDGRPGAAVTEYRDALAAVPGVAAVSAPATAGDDVTRIDVVSGVGRYTPAAKDLVRAIRAVDAPFPARVGGIAAAQVDEERSVARHLPAATLVLVVSTGVLLFLLTGSVVLPIKALVMNLLSVSVGLSALVLVFQDGRFEDALSYTSQGGILIPMAVMIAFTAFGLSTDYGVFTLSRIREAHAAGADNDEAVALGMERTGRIVTSAALLFAVAMGALVTGALIGVKETGVGIAVAVLVDATLVRAFLVPSLMALLGDRNWWAPRRLRALAPLRQEG
jgi:RND superfamily putative drug exporter